MLTDEQTCRLPACLPVMHQLLHVADGLQWLGPMHVYSQWGMERMCGMITRTAKSRVAANRNMELTLLQTEQKHVIGYVLNESDWPTADKRRRTSSETSDSESGSEFGTRGDDTNIEDGDGNLSLRKAFAHRLAGSRPEAVRGAIRSRWERFRFVGKSKSRSPRGVETQRIREYMAGLWNYEGDQTPVPQTICLWRWCVYRNAQDNKKEDFKVTSRVLRPSNNSRNSSFVGYKDADGNRAFGEVQFYFSARLPTELMSEDGLDGPGLQSEDSHIDSDDECSGTATHQLAFIRKFSVEFESDENLVRKAGSGGVLGVIPAGKIDCLMGRLKVENKEYLTARFTSLVGRMQ